MSELIAKIGDDNIRFQMLKKDVTGVQVGNKHAIISFATEPVKGAQLVSPGEPECTGFVDSFWRTSTDPIVKANREAGFPGISRSWWEMDHIVEVVRGGGGCGLDNLQTLCVPCHRAKTSRLRAHPDLLESDP